MMTIDRELLERAAKAAGMVSYSPGTGSIIWLAKNTGVKDAARWNSRYAGKECGTVDDKGYRRILFRFEKGTTFKIRASLSDGMSSLTKIPRHPKRPANEPHPYPRPEWALHRSDPEVWLPTLGNRDREIEKLAQSLIQCRVENAS